MYMYYFLGFQLAANDNLTEAQKELRARNTFLLALDGDVDFQPEAIIRLVDLMKRNPVSPNYLPILNSFNDHEYEIIIRKEMDTSKFSREK